MEPLTLTADQILAIPPDQPERLFSEGALDSCKSEFRRLARKWHSDHNPGAPDTVMTHINALYQRAQEKLAAGLWQTPWLFEFSARDGAKYRIRHLRRHAFELGDLYVCRHSVNYHVRREFMDLAESAKRAIQAMRYADDKMRAEAARTLPAFNRLIELADGSLVLRLDKAQSHISLRDVLTHAGGRLDPRHVAWIMSRLYGICCYLQWVDWMHGAISVDTVFVDPRAHLCSILGGWFYATRLRTRMTALPERTIRDVPASIVKTKTASARVDLEMVRSVGRELLGDAVGSRLPTMKDVPEALTSWLRTPAGDDAQKEFSHWQGKVLPKAFGPRKFVAFNLSESDVYKEHRDGSR